MSVDRDKFRHELKYICSDAELKILECRLNRVMNLDCHVNDAGAYLIRSVYFDDLNCNNFMENENGNNPREKWRIRAYNMDRSYISLECKRKERDMILKKSCSLTIKEYEALMNGQPELVCAYEAKPLLRRFAILMMTRHMAPAVIVQYERVPYVYQLGNVRVTFDRNITSSKDYQHFFDRDLCGRPIMPLGHQLLEVKYDEYIPDHIYHAVQLTNMSQTRFSKYQLCMRIHL